MLASDCAHNPNELMRFGDDDTRTPYESIGSGDDGDDVKLLMV